MALICNHCNCSIGLDKDDMIKVHEGLGGEEECSSTGSEDYRSDGIIDVGVEDFEDGDFYDLAGCCVLLEDEDIALVDLDNDLYCFS